jgi:hypothetical protein
MYCVAWGIFVKTASLNSEIPLECFAAKDSQGLLSNLMLSVKCRCGLKFADSLRVDAFKLSAVRRGAVLPIVLPDLPMKTREYLVAWASTGRKVPVAEFMATGLLDAYFLDLVIVS